MFFFLLEILKNLSRNCQLRYRIWLNLIRINSTSFQHSNKIFSYRFSNLYSYFYLNQSVIINKCMFLHELLNSLWRILKIKLTIFNRNRQKIQINIFYSYLFSIFIQKENSNTKNEYTCFIRKAKSEKLFLGTYSVNIFS